MNAAVIFNDLWDCMEEARASVRVAGRDVIEKALCSGLEATKTSTDYGRVESYDIVLRILSADELAGMDLGKEIEVRMDFETDWRKLRIRGKMATGGVMRYSLEAEFA